MSDVIKLKDAIKEYLNANKKLGDKLNKITADNQSRRKEKAAQSYHQS